MNVIPERIIFVSRGITVFDRKWRGTACDKEAVAEARHTSVSPYLTREIRCVEIHIEGDPG